MNMTTLLVLALVLPYAAAVVFYFTFGLSDRARTLCFATGLLATFAAPLLIPGEFLAWRLAATLNAVTVAAKFVDLQCDRQRAARFHFGGYLLYLPNPFWLCARRGPELPRPTAAQDVRQVLLNLAGAGAGLAVLMYVFHWPWQDYPFLLEHAVKVLVGIFTMVRASQVGAALWRLAGLPGHNLYFDLFSSRTPAEFWRRWNRPAQMLLYEYAFKPLGGRRSPRRAALLTFAINGLIHEYVFGLPLGHPTGVQLAFFLVQGGMVVTTMGVKPRGAWIVPAIAATAVCMLLSSVLFFASVHWIVPIYVDRGEGSDDPKVHPGAPVAVLVVAPGQHSEGIVAFGEGARVSLDVSSREQLEDELQDLGVLEYCRSALDGYSVWPRRGGLAQRSALTSPTPLTACAALLRSA